MKKIIATLIATALVSGIPGPAPAEEGADPVPAGPAISFRETVFDAGESWEGEVVTHTFTFTNTGDAELKITRVRTSCGCTASNLSSDTIAPGESGEIKASFNTRNYRGKKSQPVYVTSNDPSNPTVQLRLETTVKTVAAFTPQNLQFGKVVYGRGASRETSLVFDGEPFPVREVSAQPDFFQARILEPEGETRENSPVRIEVTLRPEAPVGRHRGTLTARIDHPQSPELSGRLMVSVEGLVRYSPRLLFFNDADQRNRKVKTIQVTNQSEEPVAILKAESTIPQFQVTVKTIEAGREFAAEVRLNADAEPGR
ncbi:MAG: DUF1573 domain-containing protein, partial [Candidatus Erginobacter occultus]|nr:DUF1573 domain-containing protein [Candidatus Erginobacter occultus]